MSSTQWETVTLGDVTTESRKRAGNDPDFHKRPVYGVDRSIGLTPVAKYTASSFERYKTLDPGMFAYNPMRLNIGSIGYCSQDIEPCLVSPDYVVFQCNEKCLNPEFLNYYIDSPAWKDWTASAGVGSVRMRIYYRELARLPFLLPPIEEQYAIAKILGTLDDKIELNRRMNQTLESMARAVFRQWFVDSEEVEEWEVERLGNFIGVNERSITRSYSHDEIEYIDISSVAVGHLEGTTKYPLKASPSRAKRLVQHGDTIWSTVRPNRKSYLFISNPKKNLIVSTGFAVLTPKKIPPSFLYFFTTTEQFVDYLVSNADGSAYPAVLPERFADAEFSIPPKYLLNKFENIAGPMLAQIAHNEKESRTLASLRDTLLPKLMKGEVRVHP